MCCCECASLMTHVQNPEGLKNLDLGYRKLSQSRNNIWPRQANRDIFKTFLNENDYNEDMVESTRGQKQKGKLNVVNINEKEVI